MSNKEMINKVTRALLSMQRYNWEQGVAAQAFLELGDTEMAALFAKEAILRQDEDGRLGMIGGGSAVTDPAANGEAVLYTARVTGDKNMAVAAEKMLDWLLNKAPKNNEGTLYHLTRSRQIWVDSFYMAPPFLAAAGYFDEAVKQIEGFRKVLWSSEKKLYSHIWDDDKNDFSRKDFWGVGNGWAASGITRVIRAMTDEKNEERRRLISYLKEVIDGCITYQREDGLFHDVLDNPNSFVETNVAQMLSYSIYRGVSGGWLERSYLEYADKMREAVYKKVDGYGLVQGVCGAPHFKSSGVAAEGQAFFLLMEAAAKEVYPD
jgi:unsaturated rhamnogalacturonyl hydrolase